MLESPAVQMALEIARGLVAGSHRRAGPVDLWQLGATMGIKRIDARAIATDGYLGIADDGQLAIAYRQDMPERRKRFTIAHELGHCILAGVQGKPIATRHREQAINSAEERAVDRIAAELIMPEAAVQRELATHHNAGSARWRVIAALRHCFEVSESAMVLRLLELRGVLAVLFRVQVAGDGPKFPLNKSTELRLHGNEYDEARRFWREATRSNRHEVRVHGPSGDRTIQCEGKLRSIWTRAGSANQYWVVGWELR